MQTVTRNDVARRAGTSSAVVSYVFNNGPRPVAPATRERVLRAAAELGYRPNALARGLRSGRTAMLGLLVPDATQPYFAAIGRAVEQAAFDRGHLTLLGNADGSTERQARYLAAFLGMDVAGLILVDAGSAAGTIRLLAGREDRVVLLHRRVRGLHAPAVLAADEDGGLLAGRHLVGHGHRRIACLTGADGHAPVTDRYRGWATAMAEAGLPVDAPVRAAYDLLDARRAARDLLGARPRPTAVFAVTDRFAHAIVDTARELGLRVPEDLAVVGMDGLPGAALSVPPLTAVEVPLTELAGHAVELLLDPGGVPAEPAVRRLPVRLVVRRSCGCEAP